MNVYSKKIKWKFLLFLLAVIIGVSSLWYTGKLVRELKQEERRKVELWAGATQKLIETDVPGDLDFLFQVIENNTTVPVLLVDEDTLIVSSRNIDESRFDHRKTLVREVKKMGKKHPPLEISLGDGKKNFIYYKDSTVLTELEWFPYIQLSVIILFIGVSYLAFSAARKSEQNQVWLGLSKETAHQLGTPTSSLLSWLEIIKEKISDEHLLKELEKDIIRLEKITERFSKIGSVPALENQDVNRVIRNAVQYIIRRTSEKVQVRLNFSDDENVWVPINAELFEWVIENLCKNAVDAMKGEGMIDIYVTDITQFVYIDVQDYGTGIPKSRFKTIFKPGYTTKERGWGLGLSLSTRIIEDYHGGKIFVNYSEPGKGSVFRIVLKKTPNLPS
ncbi:MAG: HAMP domain-containing histidine kinase [Chlorobi bacterium]|nr:HAMP domain-containing histidine kinase [Chlorobiota bacterium]